MKGKQGMVGIWRTLDVQPPSEAGGIGTMLLLTDGQVMCQAGDNRHWWALSPDERGNYSNGTWSILAPMHHSRLYFASAVLRDGTVFVAGGEYSDNSEFATLTNTAEIYDQKSGWTELPLISSFKGMNDWSKLGDAPCCVLNDGRVLVGSIDSKHTALFDPQTRSWTPTGMRTAEKSDEETWVLLPDGSVLTIDCFNVPLAEKYVPSMGSWVSAGTTPVAMIDMESILDDTTNKDDGPSHEIGPAFLLPNGRVFAIGGTGNTLLYTPPTNSSDPGTWQVGPTFVDHNGKPMRVKDAPGCLLPNGRVLCVAGPDDAKNWSGPSFFFEFDPTSSSLVPFDAEHTLVPSANRTYELRLLLLPSGQVLCSNGSGTIYIYEPGGEPLNEWRPIIDNWTQPYINSGTTYTLNGKQLNGLSQAVGYGDDVSTATNYPLVQLTFPATGNVYYCRTFDHSTMGVATGSALVSTKFTVPSKIESGNAELRVIANGIPSLPVPIQVVQLYKADHNSDLVGIIVGGSLADGDLWLLLPDGIHHIGPGDPAEHGEVGVLLRSAYQDILAGLQTIQSVQREL
jgi:hypothetical protein